MRLVGTVYRAHNPRWSFDPLSGAGAARHGGRFNRPGRQALYLSCKVETAIREAAQGLIGKIDPLTIVSYDADISDVVDLSSQDGRASANVPMSALDAAWKLLAARGETVPGWMLAESFVASGASGILVPSFARGAGSDDVNLVLWKWGSEPPHRLVVHDPERRLPKDQSSWE